MSQIPQGYTFLIPRTAAPGGGAPTPTPVRLLQAPRRSIGLEGDDLRVAVPADAWPPPGASVEQGAIFALLLGAGAEQIELGGYTIQRVEPLAYGPAHTDPTLPAGPAVPREYAVTLVTIPGLWRDGRGGLLRVGMLNRVGPDGVVEPISVNPDRKDNAALVEICLQAMGTPYDGDALAQATPMLDAIDPPGPLDWGNARPIAELEGLLDRVGATVVLANSGAKLVVRMLARAGTSVSVPAGLLQYAEPFELTSAPSGRGDTFVVTSGLTRATLVRAAKLDELEYVYFDERTGRWLSQAEHVTLYPTEIGPDDIAEFRKGPGAVKSRRDQYQRLYRAVRLVGAAADTARRLVAPPRPVSLNIPGMPQAALGPGAPAIALARVAYQRGNDQRTNTPTTDSDAPVLLGGIRAFPEAGVFAFSEPLVRISGAGTYSGGPSSARTLANDDLRIIYACEMRTGVHSDDFFVRVFRSDAQGVVQPVTDPAAVSAALNSTLSVVVEAPFLARVLIQPVASQPPTPTNDAALSAAAYSVARVRSQASRAQSGMIRFRALLDIQPGDWGGAVTSVEWDGLDTVVRVNEHLEPGSAIDLIRAAADRSYAAGIGRFGLPGSSAAMRDVTAGARHSRGSSIDVDNDEDIDPPSGGLRGVSPTRSLGRTRVLAAPVESWDIGQGRIFAEITGSTSIGPNRWSYQWREVQLFSPGVFAPVSSGGRTHATHGPAYAASEAFNTATGVQGNGVNRANLPTGWSMQPLARQVVELLGPFGAESSPWCVIAGPTNADDGTCSTQAAAVFGPSGADCGCGCGGGCGSAPPEARKFAGLDEAAALAAWGGL